MTQFEKESLLLSISELKSIIETIDFKIKEDETLSNTYCHDVSEKIDELSDIIHERK
ncbi:hypothetical protein [Chengkuizengella marina]|uniref:hypothetical protein n=1 Tax=Chengkuizengella marina TaxID=2507566 RepID=UPI001371F30E|nr:hypothetical protein [Chengkuizengella marina]